MLAIRDGETRQTEFGETFEEQQKTSHLYIRFEIGYYFRKDMEMMI